MHGRQIGPLNLGAKPYARKKSQIVVVGAGYRVLLAANDSNQVHAGDTSPKFFDMSCVHNNAAMNPYKSKRTRFLSNA
jgi:hypothetical protein